MKSISNLRLFVLSLILGVVVILALAVYDRKPPEPLTGSLTDNIALTEQIHLNDIPGIKAQGHATLIALRPDGDEAPDQPDAAQVAEAARNNQMNFAYIPVPHGDIPDAAVAAFNAATADNPGPILLYCRSGRRVARAWILAEASRPNGLEAAAIMSAARRSGQSVEDWSTAIEARIAQRPVPGKLKP